MLEPDKSAMLAPSDDEFPSLLTVGFASLPKDAVIHSGVTGHLITWAPDDIENDFDTMPLRAVFKASEDWAVLWLEKRAADVNHNPRDYDFGSRAFEESRAQK